MGCLFVLHVGLIQAFTLEPELLLHGESLLGELLEGLILAGVHCLRVEDDFISNQRNEHLQLFDLILEVALVAPNEE